MSKQAKPTYYEMLRDPRWQKKRLEIMGRDGFACRECGDKEQTLNVHHLSYEKGLAPWEYSDDRLKTLCEPCHEIVSDFISKIQYELGSLEIPRLAIMFGAIIGVRAFAGPDSLLEKETANQAIEFGITAILHALSDPTDSTMQLSSKLHRAAKSKGNYILDTSDAVARIR